MAGENSLDYRTIIFSIMEEAETGARFVDFWNVWLDGVEAELRNAGFTLEPHGDQIRVSFSDDALLRECEKLNFLYTRPGTE